MQSHQVKVNRIISDDYIDSIRWCLIRLKVLQDICISTFVFIVFINAKCDSD